MQIAWESIKRFSDIIYENLPNIFGEDADKNFINFHDTLKDNKFPVKRIKNFYYFQIGRWDLQLNNNQTIKVDFKEGKLIFI